MSRKRKSFGSPLTRAFTLIELLVVVAIVVLLVSILVPSLGRVRKLTRAAVCISNTGQTSKAIGMYTNQNRSMYWLFHHAANQYWIGLIRPYHERVDQLRLCPEATKLSYGWGAADYAWGPLSDWGDDCSGSYGMNLWLTPNDPNGNSYYDQFLQTDPITGKSFADFFWRTQAATTSNTPTITDSPWVGHWPLETDPPPVSYYYGTSVHVWPIRSCEFMGRVCIDRHNGAVNSGFCDGSARRVRLADLYLLKWSRFFVPTARPDIVPP